ncbi:hypothetical protein ACFV4M_03440 [Kitasatospora indigofera]|uniref:hypothetical protein n=1 Tax=Kitasatospora indigofera TaxID=67307 RepID=UPI0036569AE6
MAGLDSVVASLGGRKLDEAGLGQAFGANWTLGARYPVELPGWMFFRAGLRIMDIVFVVTRSDQQATPVQGLERALEAAAAWPVLLDGGTRLADFELTCQQQAHERLHERGFPALWELAIAQADTYRSVADLLVG